MTAPAAQLPDTWQTTGGLRVEILATTATPRHYFWHVRRADGRVVESGDIGYRKRRSAVREAMRRYPGDSEGACVSVTENDRKRAVEIMSAIQADAAWITSTRLEPVDRIAAALAEERERAIEPFTALADEMQHQVEYRRETNPADVVAQVRETDLRWLRLAISNAREPRA